MLGRCAEELSKFLGIKRDEVLKINQVTHVDSNDFPIFPFHWGKLPYLPFKFNGVKWLRG